MPAGPPALSDWFRPKQSFGPSATNDSDQPVAVSSPHSLEGNIWLIVEVQLPSRTRLAELGCL